MNTKKILLTGASGTVGQEVLNLLSKNADFNITAFDINNNKTSKIYRNYPGINLIHGNISSKTDIEKIPADFDIVIHLAALIPPAAEKFPELTHKINVEGTSLLVKHLEITSPNTFFIYSSSVSVYGDRVETPNIHVTDPLKISEGDIYGQSKLEAEMIVRNCQLNWSVFRLAAIMKNHKVSKLMFHMPLETHFEICTPEDTAQAFVNAINNKEKLSNQVFNLGGGENCCVSYREFLKRSFSIFGLGKLNFPKRAFADKNFHCGRMVDSDKLEELLHFRKDTIETYFEKTARSVSNFKKFFASILSPFIKWFLLFQSEPYKAYKSKNKVLINHFFRMSNI